MIHQVDEEVSMIFRDGTGLNENPENNDSSSTLNYSVEILDIESADQSHHTTVLEHDQQTTTLEEKNSSINSTIPPSPQFTLSRPSEQGLSSPVVVSSPSLNSTVQSRPHYLFAEPTIPDQYSPVTDRITNNISPVQSQSLLAQPQTPMKRNTNDRFNGILYHVHAHDGYTTIVFSSKDLFSNFMSSMDKELHPQQISETRANYNTHIRGKWCTITSDSSFGTLTLNGPGRALWRETVFIRLTIRLYQQYKSETDTDLNSSIFAQTSPVLTGVHSASLPFMSPVLPPAASDNILQPQLITSISHEVHELKKISQFLKDQVCAIDNKIDILLKKEEERSLSISSQTSFVTRSEVSEDTRLSPGSKSYSEILQSHTSSRETHNKSSSVDIINHNSDNMDNINASASSRNGYKTQTGKNRNKDQSSTKLTTQDKDSAVTPKRQCTSQSPRGSGALLTHNSGRNMDIINVSDTSVNGGNTQTGYKSDLGSNKTTPQNDTSVTEISFMNSTTNQNPRESRTLLIGDSIISGVNKKGLIKNVECLSIPGGKVDSVANKLEIFDITKFKNLIITVGGNDASNKTELGTFYETYRNLINSVKHQNAKCNLFLCTSCPRGDTDVTDINDVILQLCQEKSLTFVDVNENFYNKKKNNELRHHFYKPRDSIHLSRSGTKRLLGTINEHIPVVENFEKCVFIPYQPYQMLKTNERSQTQQRGKSLPVYTQQGSAVYQDSTRSDHNSNSQPLSAVYNQGRTKSDYNVRGHYFRQPSEQTETAAERCMKCGLTNHVTLDCFHQKQVQCHKCKCYGHKDYMGLCWNI